MKRPLPYSEESEALNISQTSSLHKLRGRYVWELTKYALFSVSLLLVIALPTWLITTALMQILHVRYAGIIGLFFFFGMALTCLLAPVRKANERMSKKLRIYRRSLEIQRIIKAKSL